MTYSINLLRLFFRRQDQLLVLHKSERIQKFWRAFFILLLLSFITYGWTSWIGLGTDPLSTSINELSRIDYEFQKAWFLIGRLGIALLLFLGIVLFTPFIFWLLFDLSYKKMVIVQMSVWLLMLVERLTWIPLMVYFGLDWYVSPLSLGVIASYATQLEWIVYFFGAISLFQIFIIWFQIRSILYLSNSRNWWIISGVIFWHVLLWSGTAALTHFDSPLVQLLLS
ncbi:hypothetical protein [Halobacillus seohaensis]|uniref:Yip1 domain-containing protein n=1 Tax=Halobacillus seohaensis TaxID=447421 RepID=A0ABW2ERX5_9BACI